jgi:hypothetical protein
MTAPLPEVVGQITLLAMFAAAAVGAARSIRIDRRLRHTQPPSHVTNLRPMPYDWAAEDRHAPLPSCGRVAPLAVPVPTDGIGARSQRPGEIAS